MPIQPSDIRNVIAKEDDFGHELRVGAAIRTCPAIHVEHGGTYTDKVTKKPRQFDYRCWLRKGQARLALAVECKNLSPLVPLVVCGIARQKEEAYHELIESRFGIFRRGSATIDGLSSITRRTDGDSGFYPANEFVGKSLVRIQADKMSRLADSDIYDKWSQSISSGVELVREAKRS